MVYSWILININYCLKEIIINDLSMSVNNQYNNSVDKSVVHESESLVSHHLALDSIEPASGGDVLEPRQTGPHPALPAQFRPAAGKIYFSVLHSHWSRSNEARLSLFESFRVLGQQSYAIRNKDIWLQCMGNSYYRPLMP